MTTFAFDPANDDLIIAKPRKEIVFIEDNVADYQTIAANVGAGRQVVILDSTKDGLEQIADAVKGMSGIDALHIVTHGAQGKIALGALTLDQASAAQHQDVLATIGTSLAAGGDILFYGCSVGAGLGAGLVTQLAIATGADVAASSDATGGASLGGNWDLEVRAGSIDAVPVVDAALAAQYHGLLNISYPITVDFSTAPHTGGSNANTDLAYTIPGSSYVLRFNGHKDAVWSYGTDFAPNAYVSFSQTFIEDEITIGFEGGQLFTLTSLKVNGNASSDQTLVFTGKRADGSEVTHADVHIPVGEHITDFSLQGLSGFTNITTLVITPQAGQTIQYFQIDDLVLSNIQPVPPKIGDVTSSAPAHTYKLGETVDILVMFDNPVDVTGTPQLTLETGTTDRVINYTSGSGGSTLTFQYTVQAGDLVSSLDYKGSAIALNGGTIKAHGNSTLNATLTLPTPGDPHSLAANTNIAVDGVVPTLTIDSDPSSLGVGETATITFTFSDDPGTDFDASDIVVSGGTLSALHETTGIKRTATFTPTANIDNGTATFTVAGANYADAAGNKGANASLSFGYDTKAPNDPSAPVLLTADDKGDSSTDGITNKGTLQFSGTAEANATVTLYDTNGTTVVGTGSADVSGNWSIVTSALANGSHTIKVKAFDAAGNASNLVTGPIVTVDTTPPTLAITSDTPLPLKAGETATIKFTFSDDPGTDFDASDIVVSGGTLSALHETSGKVRTATFTPTADTDAGSASIRVLTGAYHDLAGNDGNASNNLTLSYDTLAPSKPSAPSLAVNDDTGASNSDYVTKANPLTLSGTADNGATVKLYDGATEIGSVTASGGSYSFTLTGLAEGNHTFVAVAVDAAGNVGAVSDGLAVTVDRTPPSTTIASATLSADTGISTTDMVTKEASQTISGIISANLAAGEQVMVSLDNGATWTAASASVGSNTWTLGATLAGSGTLKVQVVDLAGNGGAVYAHAYVLDTVAPAASSLPDLDSGSDSGSSTTDNITGVTLPSFNGTAEVGAKVTLFDGGIEIGSDIAEDGTWHITTSSGTPLDQRIHYITAEVTDLAGNHSATSPVLELDVRTVGPATTVASLALASDSGTAGDFITNVAAQTLSGTLSANLAAGERVQVSLNNGATWSNAISAVGANTWSLPLTLAAGSHDIQVRVIDSLDNFGAVRTQAYTLDAVKPGVTISSNVAQLKAGETATITFTFSEDPGASFTWNGSSGDVSVSGGTLSAIEGSGATRTATFTPDANLNGGTATISVNADSYQDTAGNLGTAGATPLLSFDTLAPAAPSAPDLHKDSDSGALDTDDLTNNTALVFTGTAEAGATVRLYDSDGTTEIGHATATGGNWTITASTLLNGEHTVTAKAFDAAGNASAASGPLTVTIDSIKPAALAAPAFKTGSDSGTANDGITNVKKPAFTGSAEAFAQVTLYDGATVLGTASANAAGSWEFTPAADLLDGTHAISARQTDRAGNQSDAGTAFNVTVDTVALAAPAAPSLAAASDTDTPGDGVTENDMPVIEGTALANTLVTLYDISGSGKGTIGSVMTDGSGKWSIATAGLAVGSHSLSVTQTDAAGNESVHSAPFLLRIDAPPVVVANLIDGVAVDIQPISLPGGVMGSAVSIPVVGAGRVDSSGQASVADIPLLTSSQGNPLLMAAVPVGIGLSANGASVPKVGGAELLIAAIKAATPSHDAADQGHLTGNGQSFLAALAAGGTLLVETVKPVSAAGAPNGVLTLSGPAQPQGQSTALVIDAGGLGAGATIALQNLDFAAVIGAANVVSTGSMILSGDAASQHFTVAAGTGPNAVLAGGGNDTLTLSPPAAGGTGAGAVMLHGGSANDVAVFSGARADYNIAFHNAYATVTSKSGPATTATVVNVETLQFSDGQVVVQNSADMSTLAGLYQTVLGRQADIGGIEFWANGHQAGANWGNIALNMIGSSERLASHEGFNGVAAHDLTLLYTALFNRAPDAEGLAFWLNAMNHGVSLEHVADEFVKSAEMGGHLRGALDWDFINA